MTDIHQRHKSVILIKPNDANIHIYAEFKQIVCSPDPFGAQ